MWCGLSHLQWSMVVFIAFTAIQVLVFVLDPEKFDTTAFDFRLEAPPYAFYTLIGLKEVGLMCMYAAFVFDNDRVMMLMTAIGRLSTAVYGMIFILLRIRKCGILSLHSFRNAPL